jgi:hypothetical protein
MEASFKPSILRKRLKVNIKMKAMDVISRGGSALVVVGFTAKSIAGLLPCLFEALVLLKY